MKHEKLFLIDAYALIYRAYYALLRSPRFTSGGLNTSAIFGFLNTLDDIMRRQNPTLMAVCFDPEKGHTFRHEQYPDYKAGRQKQPEDITLAIPYIKDILRARGITVIEQPGYEADDVIGTLALRAQAHGITTYMVTMDKDYGQLVTPQILMYRPALKGKDFEIRGPQEVCSRYGIEEPRQVIDLLALEGDASDNIPGCPGVGEKTAVKLLAQYGNVENIIAHAAEIPGALGRKIAQGAQSIAFSKQLVTICTEVPLDTRPGDLAITPGDPAELVRLYTALEFKTLLAKMTSAAPAAATTTAPAPVQPSLFDAPADVDAPAPAPAQPFAQATPGQLDALLHTLARGTHTLAMALMAQGPEAMTATLLGMALATETQRLWVPPALIGRLEGLCHIPGLTIASHQTKRDIVLLRNLWPALADVQLFDTSLAHYLINPEAPHHIADVAHATLGLRLSTLDMPSTERRRQPTTASAPGQGAEEALATLALVGPLRQRLNDLDLWQLYTQVELPLAPVLAAMEIEGVSLDVAELNAMARGMTQQLQQLNLRAIELAGVEFNPASPTQVGEVLFDRLQIDPGARRTKTGSFSTSEEVLESYRTAHPIVEVILQYRRIKKLLSTYVEALPRMVNPATGRIHTTFNQTATATGRLSSTNPNLQNIPVRTDLGREIRRAFVATPGCVILSADYSQIELRLMAHFSAEPQMLEAFRQGHDIHRETAAKIFGVPPQDVTDDMRRSAKTANFGIIYGISAFGLSQRLGIPRAQAKTLIDGYMRTYPGIKQYIDQAVETARRQGYVATAMKRRRYLPEITSRNATVRAYAERNAVNAPLQGTAADIIKLAMVRIHAQIRALGLEARMIMQVHDELIFNAPPHEIPTLQTLVTQTMRQAFPQGLVPLEVSSGVAPNWLEAH